MNMRFSRTFALLAVALLPCSWTAHAQTQGEPEVQLHWLKHDSARDAVGTTWGTPWPEGAVGPESEFRLNSDTGPLPVQSWPLAYWPDGSLKWTGHAIAPLEVNDTALTLRPGDAPQPEQTLTVREDKESIRVDTGSIQAVLSKSGDRLIQSITRAGRKTLNNGRLVVLSQGRAEPEVGEPLTVNAFAGRLDTL